MHNTHPLILVAASAVTIASLAAAAHFTGLIPSRSESPPPAAVASQSVPLTAAPAPPSSIIASPKTDGTVSIAPEGNKVPPTIRPRPQAAPAPAKQVHRSEPRYSDAPPAYSPPPVCHECGTVDNVREVVVQGEGTGVGAVAGGVLGGVLGNQVGRGRGNDAATVLGAIGGAVAGHQIEKNTRTNKQYQITVRFDDGNTRTFTLSNVQWRPGDRVRLAGGALAPL